jgi:hypothetical protein
MLRHEYGYGKEAIRRLSPVGKLPVRFIGFAAEFRDAPFSFCFWVASYLALFLAN